MWTQDFILFSSFGIQSITFRITAAGFSQADFLLPKQHCQNTKGNAKHCPMLLTKKHHPLALS